MKCLTLSIAALLMCATGAKAQFGNFADVPIEITAEKTGVDRNIATADQNVIIRYGEVALYCDHAQYNPETRDILVEGNVRIYREGRLITGERAIYNLETKQLTASDFRGEFAPFLFSGDSVSSLGSNAYLIKDGLFTTSDSSKPDYFIRAKTVRVYPKDRIIFTNAKFYIGRTPVFWFPYLYQSLDKDRGFLITPGYNSVLGAHLLGQYSFPVGDMGAKLHLDIMSERGVGMGLDLLWNNKPTATPGASTTSPTTKSPLRGSNQGNWGRFRSYYIYDANPETNETALTREPIDPSRYRVSFQNRTYLTEDIYASIDINKLSDARFLQDFEPGEFRVNPNPDNVLNLTKWDENYSFSLLARKSLNEESFDATERLPEGALDIKRQPLFGSKFFYDGQTSAGFYRRNFSGDSVFTDYDTFRADTFHQLTYPGTYFGWLSLVPKVGVRATYYENSGTYGNAAATGLIPGQPAGMPTALNRALLEQGSVLRPVVNAGLETSFKIARTFDQVQSRALGLDGLRHIIQPYSNLSFVYTGEDPVELLQFDRLNRSTQLAPIDFPQFNAIDSIDNWSILRLGTRNRLQTRRDGETFNWLEIDTFFDINFDRPNFDGLKMPDGGNFSNIFNRLRFAPLPWFNLQIDSQLPVLDRGFTEVNTSLNFMATRDLQFNVGNRYINGNPLINDSNLVSFGSYLRLNDHWAVGFRQRYEFEESGLQSQLYQVHRDLSSWVASLGFIVFDNRSNERTKTEYGMTLSFALKDVPSVRLPVNFDPESFSGSGSGKNQ